MRYLILCATLAILSTAAAAADKPDPNKPVNPGDKIICKSEMFVGSMIPKRVCMTRSQWERGAEDAKDAIESQRRRYEKGWAPTGPG